MIPPRTPGESAWRCAIVLSLKTVLASFGDAIIMTDDRGKITYLNVVAADLTGWGSEEALGMPLRTVFKTIDEQSRELVENSAIRVLEGNPDPSTSNRIVIVSRDGEEKPIRISIRMNNSSGIYQVDGLLKAKLRGSGLEPYVEVIAHIDTEAEKRLVPLYELEL